MKKNKIFHAVFAGVLPAVFFLLSAAPLFSLSAVVKETRGKVELKAPGGGWRTAEVGMEVGTGTTISTGFNSTAEIAIGNSILQVRALTRMALDELIEKEGTINTELNLKVGKVKAEVRTTGGLLNNFKLRSPQSTAAVRGTVFEYDGYTLSVDEGSVVFSNNLGQVRMVATGEQSGTDGYTIPDNVEDLLASEFDVDLSAITEEDIIGFMETNFPAYATLILNLNWFSLVDEGYQIIGGGEEVLQ